MTDDHAVKRSTRLSWPRAQSDVAECERQRQPEHEREGDQRLHAYLKSARGDGRYTPGPDSALNSSRSRVDSA
jgi:hypothetical protein